MSVVTPVYNGARYIGECIESVLAQTYPHFEYIVLDNCSSDGTAETVRAYAARDHRLRFVAADEFVGALENANRALRLISSESVFTKVVHADDMILPNCLEQMTKVGAGSPSVGLIGAYRRVGAAVMHTDVPRRVTVVPGRDAGRAHLLGSWGYFFGSPTSVMYRSDLVRKRSHFYNVGNPFQADQEACLDLLVESDFAFVHQVLTVTRRHDAAESSYFARVAAEAPGQLDLVLRFGRNYLSEEEFRRRVAARTVGYGASLLRHAPRLRRQEYRAYHASFLRTRWRELDPRDVAVGGANAIARRFTR